MRRDEKGYIVVETIGSFLLFVLLMVSIITLINIVSIQARMHYALTQAAEAVSMYSYILDKVGLADTIMGVNAKHDETAVELGDFSDSVNGLINGISGLSSSGDIQQSVEDIKSNGEQVINKTEGFVNQLADDPKSVMQSALTYILSEGASVVLGELAEPLVLHYMNNGGTKGRDYLEAFRVDVDSFQWASFATEVGSSHITDNSVFLDADGDIKLVLQYDIEYTFGALPLPFDKIHVTQEVVTKAWLGGEGDGYEP